MSLNVSKYYFTLLSKVIQCFDLDFLQIGKRTNLNITTERTFILNKQEITIHFSVQKLSKYLSFFGKDEQEDVVGFQTVFNATIQFPALN